jgi:hypothetical protein
MCIIYTSEMCGEKKPVLIWICTYFIYVLEAENQEENQIGSDPGKESDKVQF